MDIKNIISIFFGILGVFVIGVAVMAVYQVLFKTGGTFDLALTQVFQSVVDKITAVIGTMTVQ